MIVSLGQYCSKFDCLVLKYYVVAHINCDFLYFQVWHHIGHLQRQNATINKCLRAPGNPGYFWEQDNDQWWQDTNHKSRKNFMFVSKKTPSNVMMAQSSTVLIMLIKDCCLLIIFCLCPKTPQTMLWWHSARLYSFCWLSILCLSTKRLQTMLCSDVKLDWTTIVSLPPKTTWFLTTAANPLPLLF